MIQQAIDKAYAECEVMKDECSDMRDFYKRLEEAAKKHEDITLFDVGYTAMPVDADGEVWHAGDLAVGELNPNNPQRVKRILWWGPDLGWWQLETDDLIFSYPERLRHYYKPTIKDMLKEYRIKCYNLIANMKNKDIVNGKEYAQAIETLDIEYAQKLQNWSEND